MVWAHGMITGLPCATRRSITLPFFSASSGASLGADGGFQKWGYPLFIIRFWWDFPWNKPTILGYRMVPPVMEIPILCRLVFLIKTWSVSSSKRRHLYQKLRNSSSLSGDLLRKRREITKIGNCVHQSLPRTCWFRPFWPHACRFSANIFSAIVAPKSPRDARETLQAMWRSEMPHSNLKYFTGCPNNA